MFRPMTKVLFWVTLFATYSCSGGETKDAGGDAGNCSIGAVGCACTQGGGCDPGLMCAASMQCVDPSCTCDTDSSCSASCSCDSDCGGGTICTEKIYDAYNGADGPNCGADGSLIAECLPGDMCSDDELGECAPPTGPTVGCGDQTYAPYNGADGPNCGADGSLIAECRPGDVCEDDEVGVCRYVHSPPGSNCPDEPYQAYNGAGGPNCGADGSLIAECEPGDSCIDDELGTCN